MESFGCDSYIRINDPTNFSIAISRLIPGFTTGLEGVCLYQENKIIERDLGYIDIEHFKKPNNPQEVDQERMQQFINDQMSFYPFLLKSKEFAHQSEYRLLWLTSGEIPDYIDIKVPEAIQYCDKPSEITE